MGNLPQSVKNSLHEKNRGGNNESSTPKLSVKLEPKTKAEKTFLRKPRYWNRREKGQTTKFANSFDCLKNYSIEYCLIPFASLNRLSKNDPVALYGLLEKYWFGKNDTLKTDISIYLRKMKSDRKEFLFSYPISRNFAIYEKANGDRVALQYLDAINKRKVDFNVLIIEEETK